MAMTNRIEGGAGLNREQRVSFRFNGKSYQGFDGDTLASALLANGVTLTARSFKYHRPRGIVGNGYEEPSSLVELTGDEQSGNQPITRVRVRPGLEAKSVNCWPSPDFDLMAINRLFARMIPAAFYYKTFKWPDWRLFEPSIRRAAGLAAAPAEVKHQGHYETRHAHCDILIVGAGPAGLLAAVVAANSGARVLLADDGDSPGGSLQNQKVDIDGAPAADWVASVTAQLDQHENVTRLAQASVWAYREHNMVVITERAPREPAVFQRSWRVRARRVIVAAGAIERHLVFGHNDRPGVMLASAVQAYVNRYAVRPGKRVVLFGNNNSIYRVGADLRAAGVAVAAIVDSRATPDAGSIALADGIKVFGHHVIEKTGGGKRITSVTLQDLSSGSRLVLSCDLLGVSGGWNPTLHLYSQSRSRLEYDAKLATFLPGEAVQDCCCIGASTGAFTLAHCFDDAVRKTRDTLASLGVRADDIVTPTVETQPDYAIEALWHVDVDDALAAKSFVDIQNDVTLADVHLAMREGFGAVEHVKRYTTAGMGIDQGKTGNLNVIGAIANASGSGFDEIGMTTFRSPYVPIEFGAMTGIREGSVYLPYRHTPITQWNKDNGAFMYEAGARWRRPGYYPQSGESFQQTVNRESLAVRDKVAVYDGAPLGKFEIKGPDAEKLVEMLYTSNFASLKTGMGRYGIMLSDDGLILDDGVTFKLGDNHYLMSTSTGHADAINRHMEFFLQTHRPEWRVKITTVTTQWANATVCGPRARELLQALGTDIDLSPESFPFMAMRDATVAGIATRICRVSFTGELSFEINVRPRHALQLWQAVIEAGKPFDLIPIGSEANHVLRVEKGFLSLGHEVDGTTDPYDLGMDWIMSKTKADYLGKRALEIRRSSTRTRHELVGLLPDDPEQMLDESAPLTPGGRREASEGLVTACVWSVVQNRVIALSLLKDGRNRIGEKVHIRMKDRVVSAEVTAPCFHDPTGALLRS